MNKLSKQQADALSTFHERAIEAQKAFDEAREAYLAAKGNVVEILTEAAEAVREIESDAQSYYDERSERWQEGDKGQAYYTWIDDIGTRASCLEVDESVDDDEIDGIIANLDPDQFPFEPEG